MRSILDELSRSNDGKCSSFPRAFVLCAGNKRNSCCLGNTKELEIINQQQQKLRVQRTAEAHFAQ